MKGNITTKVPAELESAASNGVVVSSDGVYDYKKGKFQEDVNEGVSDDIAAIKGGSNKSLAQIDNQLQQIAAHDVISMAGGDVNVSTNGDDFSDASKASYVPTIGSILGSMDAEPTPESEKLVKSGGVKNELALGAVYDVSAKNPTAGPNNDGKFESLSALLSDANINTLIPIAVRKGGMSIKFVQSSDNNSSQYVQYRYMGTATTGSPNPFLDTAKCSIKYIEKSLGLYSFR